MGRPVTGGALLPWRESFFLRTADPSSAVACTSYVRAHTPARRTEASGGRTSSSGAERRFRRLNAPHLLAKVYAGVRYVDGVEVTQEVAA